MSNEITVKLKCSIENFCEILQNKKFKLVEKYLLNDTYFIPKNLNISKLIPREILSNAVLLRDINDYMLNTKICKFTFKNKQINEDGIILNQENIDCDIVSIEQGQKFIKSIGYKELMNIKENDTVYEKDSLKIAIKDVINGDNLIEVETVDNNIELNTIEKIISKINELNIPIYTNDYFIKKAVIELKKVL